ncbi:MAG: patatin-like phospholipase family protein [Bacteroidota bacterium]
MASQRDSEIYKMKEVIEEEKAFIKKRREKLNPDEAKDEIDNLFGLAMSGGGIRSAILNLGFAQYLNEQGLLKKADYLSTVSGGGYTGSYIQVTLKNAKALKHQADIEVDMHENANLDLGDNPPAFKELYRNARFEHLKAHGKYMIPGTGWQVRWNQLVLVVSYLSSLIMSYIGPAIAIAIMYLFVDITNDYFTNQLISVEWMKQIGFERMSLAQVLIRGTWIGLLVLFITHFLANIGRNYSLDVSLNFDRAKSFFVLFILGFVVLSGLVLFFSGFTLEDFSLDIDSLINIGVLAGLLFVGFFANPNALSLHRLYRKRLSDAFLESGGSHKNVLLTDLALIHGEEEDYAAPYPLINTCLNLQAGKTDDSFMGSKSNDYFLLSPFFCGSKLTGYLQTRGNEFYRRMTLPTAMSISAAAVNPGMGNYSNPVLAFLTTILNLRLGTWALNPKRLAIEEDVANVDMKMIRKEMNDPDIKARIEELVYCQQSGELSIEQELELQSFRKKQELLDYYGKNPLTRPFQNLVWWPKYFFYELFSGINTKHRMVNISDGGHIENLAVYELLRRRCKLIICFDGGADPDWTYADLHNLVVRARNELSIEIAWRDDQIPENVISAKPSDGFSRTHFAVADILELTEEKGKKGKIGVFVYVKSSVTPPSRKKDVSLQSDSYR